MSPSLDPKMEPKISSGGAKASIIPMASSLSWLLNFINNLLTVASEILNSKI